MIDAATYKVYGQTDVGQVRAHNEDNFAICLDLSRRDWRGLTEEQLLQPANLGMVVVVADGMGGAAAGEVASDIAITSMREQFATVNALPTTEKNLRNLLKGFVFNAHRAIVAAAQQNYDLEGMGTTLTVAWFFADKVALVWSGDSRAYRYQPNGIVRKTTYDSPYMEILTRDHSMVWDLVEKGKLTAEEARLHANSNVITQSLGDPDYPPKPDFRLVNLHAEDRVLVCSDGLNGMLPDPSIEQLLKQAIPLEQVCADLIEAANLAGGEDNTTVAVVQVEETGQNSLSKLPEAHSKAITQHTQINAEAATDGVFTTEDSKSTRWYLVALGLLIMTVAIYGFSRFTADSEGSELTKAVSPVEVFRTRTLTVCGDLEERLTEVGNQPLNSRLEVKQSTIRSELNTLKTRLTSASTLPLDTLEIQSALNALRGRIFRWEQSVIDYNTDSDPSPTPQPDKPVPDNEPEVVQKEPEVARPIKPNAEVIRWQGELTSLSKRVAQTQLQIKELQQTKNKNGSGEQLSKIEQQVNNIQAEIQNYQPQDYTNYRGNFTAQQLAANYNRLAERLQQANTAVENFRLASMLKPLPPTNSTNPVGPAPVATPKPTTEDTIKLQPPKKTATDTIDNN